MVVPVVGTVLLIISKANFLVNGLAVQLTLKTVSAAVSFR